MRYFSYDPEMGFDFHPTEEKAKAAAEASLGEARDAAGSDGWGDNMNICWGEVREIATITSRKVKPPADQLDGNYDADGTYWGEWDEIVEYEMLAPRII